MEKKNNVSNYVENKTEIIIKKIAKKNDKILQITDKKIINTSTIKYVLEDSYFIEGVEYIPSEDYTYSQIGLSTFYGKELHNVKTINNDLNKVTELLGRHKTLPIPSIVKITNLENGFSLVIKVNDRHNDNSSLIQVSRKVAQLLRFYKNKIAKVKVEILSDPSKQMKIVTLSMNDPDFSTTIKSAPTESVSISNLDESDNSGEKQLQLLQPIEMGFEELENQDLYLAVYHFTSYDEINKIFESLDINFKRTIRNEGEDYSILIGPLENIEANNLVLSFISKGYKKTEIILK